MKRQIRAVIVTLLAAERLRDCRVLVVESPFADLEVMSMRRIAAPIRPLSPRTSLYGCDSSTRVKRASDFAIPAKRAAEGKRADVAASTKS